MAQEPMRTMGPVGWGTPPAGSTVTASVTDPKRAGSGSASSRAFPSGSTVKVPALTGASPTMNHSWYVLSGGKDGRLYTFRNTRPLSGSTKALAMASGAGPRPGQGHGLSSWSHQGVNELADRSELPLELPARRSLRFDRSP